MGNHLRNGQFLSDKYAVYRFRDGKCASPDKLVLSFHDPAARAALQLFANMTADAELAIDIKARLRSVGSDIRDDGSNTKKGTGNEQIAL